VCRVLLPEESRDTAIGNMHRKFGEGRACCSGDMIADRQTHTQTDRHAHHNTPLPYRGGVRTVECRRAADTCARIVPCGYSAGGWLGSRVVSVLDSGAEGPRFKSQSRRCPVSLGQTVYTHCASVHQAAKLVAALVRVAGVTAGLAESNGSLPSGF